MKTHIRFLAVPVGLSMLFASQVVAGNCQGKDKSEKCNKTTVSDRASERLSDKECKSKKSCDRPQDIRSPLQGQSGGHSLVVDRSGEKAGCAPKAHKQGHRGDRSQSGVGCSAVESLDRVVSMSNHVFDRMDRNEDGHLDRTEFLATASAMQLVLNQQDRERRQYRAIAGHCDRPLRMADCPGEYKSGYGTDCDEAKTSDWKRVIRTIAREAVYLAIRDAMEDRPLRPFHRNAYRASDKNCASPSDCDKPEASRIDAGCVFDRDRDGFLSIEEARAAKQFLKNMFEAGSSAEAIETKGSCNASKKQVSPAGICLPGIAHLLDSDGLSGQFELTRYKDASLRSDSKPVRDCEKGEQDPDGKSVEAERGSPSHEG